MGLNRFFSLGRMALACGLLSQAPWALADDPHVLVSGYANAQGVYDSQNFTTDGQRRKAVRVQVDSGDGDTADCAVGAKMGVFMPTVLKLSRTPSVDYDSVGCQTMLDSIDSVIAGAPDVADGTPIRYVATLVLRMAYLPPPAERGYLYLQTMVQVEDGRYYWDGPTAVDAHQEITLQATYDAVAGQALRIRALVNSYNELYGLSDMPVSGSLSLRGARLVLTSPTPGANITGQSGHVYQ